MRRLFRITDCTQHIGLPVKAACFLLNVFSCPMYIFVLYFLPENLVIPFMASELIVGVVGLVGSVCSVRVFVIFYIVTQILMTIAVWVAGSYLIFVLANYNGWFYDCFNGTNWYECNPTSDYLYKLFSIENWILWTALSLACVGTILACISIAGFRKLRLYILQKSDREVSTQPVAGPPAAPPTVIQQPVYVIQQPHNGNLYQPPYGLPPQGFMPQGTPQPLFFSQGYEPPPAYLDFSDDESLDLRL